MSSIHHDEVIRQHELKQRVIESLKKETRYRTPAYIKKRTQLIQSIGMKNGK